MGSMKTCKPMRTGRLDMDWTPKTMYKQNTTRCYKDTEVQKYFDVIWACFLFNARLVTGLFRPNNVGSLSPLLFFIFLLFLLRRTEHSFFSVLLSFSSGAANGAQHVA